MSKDRFDSDGVRSIRSMNIVDITRIIGRIGVNDGAGAGTATASHSRRKSDAQQST
jgi:hypothetical protein